MPGRKATWEEIEQRVEAFPEKDREDVRVWVEYRRDEQEVAPGTARCDLQRLYEGSLATEKPLKDAARDGTLAPWCKERAKRVKSDPWFYLGRWRLFLAFHDLPHEWTIPPKKGPSTRRKRQKTRALRGYRVVTLAEFQKAVASCGSPMRRALLYLLWDTGMRPGEALSLFYDGIEVEPDGNLYAQLPSEEDAPYGLKTGPRRVALVESVAPLKEWLSNHPTKAGPLFPGERGDVLSMKVLQGLIKETMPGHTAKSLRHTRATRAALEEWNDEMMRFYFGWERGSPMPSHYSHMTQRDANRRRLIRAGLMPSEETDEERAVLPVTCAFCNVENARENVFCWTCRKPLRADLVAKAQDEERAAKEDAMNELLARILRLEKQTRAHEGDSGGGDVPA